MSTIRGMFTDPNHACLLATYLMDMTIVISTRGWKYVDKPGVILIEDEFEDWIENNINQFPPTNTIGRISIISLPMNLFAPITATGAYLHDYLQGTNHYVFN